MGEIYQASTQTNTDNTTYNLSTVRRVAQLRDLVSLVAQEYHIFNRSQETLHTLNVHFLYNPRGERAYQDPSAVIQALHSVKMAHPQLKILNLRPTFWFIVPANDNSPLRSTYTGHDYYTNPSDCILRRTNVDQNAVTRTRL
jgi:hypothetical protein